PATPRPHRLISGQMTSYAVTQRVAAPCDDVTYPVTPSLLGRKIVWAGGGAGGGPAGTWVSTQRPLRTATSRAAPSRKVRFSSQPFDFAWNFPLRPNSRMTFRWSVLRMICGSRLLPLAPPTLLPKLSQDTIAKTGFDAHGNPAATPGQKKPFVLDWL